MKMYFKDDIALQKKKMLLLTEENLNKQHIGYKSKTTQKSDIWTSKIYWTVQGHRMEKPRDEG